MKKILTLGDSFTYGDELEDRTNAFSHLIAKQLNMDVVNLGECGSGNYKIIRKLLEQDINQYGIVVMLLIISTGTIIAHIFIVNISTTLS